MNKIVFYMGPSSSGKDTFFAKTLSLYEIQKITPLTTRPKRVNEVDGREYYFLNEEEMNKLFLEHKLIDKRDYNTVNGIWSYAISKEFIKIDLYNYLTINTWEGYKNFLKYYQKDMLIPVYFQIDDGIRLQRALDREKQAKNSDYAEMCRRFLADAKDFTEELIDYYKPYIIRNDGKLSETLEQIDDLMVRKLGILPKQK